MLRSASLGYFFFSAPAPTELYTLSLHDALPILVQPQRDQSRVGGFLFATGILLLATCRLSPVIAGRSLHVIPTGKLRDRKSTRLNSSHGYISYAVICLKKKTHEVLLVLDATTGQ